MHRYRPSTAGERLCQYIHKAIEDERAWRYLLNVIRPIGDCERLAAYYRHHAALYLTCKLISAGKSVTQSDPGNVAILSGIVESYPWNRLNEGNRLLRLLSTAIKSSNRPISSGLAKELIAYAKSRHPHCYICGTRLQFEDRSRHDWYTAEHLWPSSYGGDSVEENLLPACKDCNEKKGNVATWVATDVHTLFLGINPDGDHLQKIPFMHRYAVYHRAAFSLAVGAELSLKGAFLKIKPWCDARVHDTELSADMFNICTHEELPNFEL